MNNEEKKPINGIQKTVDYSEELELKKSLQEVRVLLSK